jgi:hypothetical protein
MGKYQRWSLTEAAEDTKKSMFCLSVEGSQEPERVIDKQKGLISETKGPYGESVPL